MLNFLCNLFATQKKNCKANCKCLQQNQFKLILLQTLAIFSRNFFFSLTIERLDVPFSNFLMTYCIWTIKRFFVCEINKSERKTNRCVWACSKMAGKRLSDEEKKTLILFYKETGRYSSSEQMQKDEGRVKSCLHIIRMLLLPLILCNSIFSKYLLHTLFYVATLQQLSGGCNAIMALQLPEKASV